MLRHALLCALFIASCGALPTLSDTAAGSESLTVLADGGHWTANKLFMGCHSDSGFTHEPRGFYSQMVFGESFETALPEGGGPLNASNPWSMYAGMSGESVAVLDGVSFFHGVNSLKLIAKDEDLVGAVNRGLGNEGLTFEAKKSYEGYFFAKASKMVTFKVWFQNENGIVAEEDVEFEGSKEKDKEWTQLHFHLTPREGASCEGLQAGDKSVVCTPGPNPSHLCVKCFGGFGIGLKGGAHGAEANVDYVFVQPGAWGRFKGLQIIKDPIEGLLDIGVTAIRQGGSFTDPDYYFWKNWRGKPWTRPSLGAEWGKELISGWGPFEFIDMCKAAGIEPIMTTTAQDPVNTHKESQTCCSPEDMADLVEYAWGNEHTKWGKQRAEDGHPEPYEVKFFELGNEQYNSDFSEQVKAMEERATKLGHRGEFFYISPNNGNWLTDPEEAVTIEALGIRDHAVMDQHVGYGCQDKGCTDGAVERAGAKFEANPGLTMGSVNFEVNAGTHQMPRALAEATDINDHLNCDPRNDATAWCSRIHVRTASFCTERSGHYDAFDQGITFFLPNMTWIQPAGYTHKMIHDTWQPNMLTVHDYTGNPTPTASAAVSSDSKSLTLRLVNTGNTTMEKVVVIKGMEVQEQALVTELASPSQEAYAGYSGNPPGQPNTISPVTYKVHTDDSGVSLVMKPFSFVTVVLKKAE